MTSNLITEIVKHLEDKLGLVFVNEKTTSPFGYSSKVGESFPPLQGYPNNGQNSPPSVDSPNNGHHSPPLMGSPNNGHNSPPSMESPNNGQNSPPSMDSPNNGQNTLPSIDFPKNGYNSPPLMDSPINGHNSPPLEGCLKGGVVNIQNPKGGILLSQTLTKINSTPIYRNFVENLPHNPALNQLAKDKRKEGILSEVLFWQQVHKNKFHNIDFDRQRIIGNYIVDFYVKTLGLVVEIDGNSHDDKQEYDAERQAYLEDLGLKVFRCTDLDVKKNINSVMSSLEDFIVNEFGEKSILPIEQPAEGGEFAPIDILNYIYAILYSPTYREKFKEFLKIDFPGVPYPKDTNTFWHLVKLGSEIHQKHLMENSKVEEYSIQYPIGGDNVITKIRFEENYEIIDGNNVIYLDPLYEMGRVYINDTQYFQMIPTVAWEFNIGSYQPAQKWLKDRKGLTLEIDDILHYQKIIVVLKETDSLMKEIDKINFE